MIERVPTDPNWLSRAIASVKAEVATWPEWMRPSRHVASETPMTPKPPFPPEIGRIFRAAKALRDEADALLATFGEDDEATLPLMDAVDYFDSEMSRLGQWILMFEEPTP